MTLVGLVLGGQALHLAGDAFALMPGLGDPFAQFEVLGGGFLAFLVGTLIQLAGFVVPAAAAAASLAGFVGATIAVPMWMHRCFRNLPALGATDSHWSPPMAAGAWFIPFGNLFIPYLVIRQLWAKADGSRVPSWPLPALWWSACIATVGLNLVGHFDADLRGGVQISFGGEGREPFNSFAALAAVVAGSLLVTIILRVTRWQRDRHAVFPRDA